MLKNKNKNSKGSLRSSLPALPMYAFTAVFVAAPMVYTLVLSFMTKGSGWDVIPSFTLENYAKIFDKAYISIFADSARLAVMTTVICAVLGYPAGLATAGLGDKARKFFLMSNTLPFWINSLLRLYGWIIIFRADGILDRVLMAVGLTDRPLKLLYTYPAILTGMVYVLLPFMIYSVYSAAAKLDSTGIEAARDLGAGPVRAFFSVTLPLTVKGLLSGITLTFIPSMGLFFVANILGGGKTVLVGNLINDQLMNSRDLPFAAALSVVLMILTATVISLSSLSDPVARATRRSERREKRGGAS